MKLYIRFKKKLSNISFDIIINIAFFAVLFYFSYLFLSYDLGGSPIRFSFGGLLFLPLISTFKNEIGFHLFLTFLQSLTFLLLLFKFRYKINKLNIKKIVLVYILSMLTFIIIGILTFFGLLLTLK